MRGNSLGIMKKLGMTMESKLDKRLPCGYKQKKFLHCVYYDIENVQHRGVAQLIRMKVQGITMAFHKKFSAKALELVESSKLSQKNIHQIEFAKAAPNRADDLLINAFKFDCRRYAGKTKTVFVLMSNDKKLKAQFRDIAIKYSVDFNLISFV